MNGEGSSSSAGVLPSWVDAWGHSQVVDPDDLEQVASLLGSFPPLVFEPVVVAWDGVLPSTAVPGGADCWIVTEDNERLDSLDQPLPLGYHRLYREGSGEAPLVISAPVRAHSGPDAVVGVFAPLYELRTEADRGAGNLRGLRELAEGLLDAGVTLIGTTPMLARAQTEASPYSPVTRRFWGEHIVDFSAIDELKLPEFQGEQGGLVDYGAFSVDVEAATAAYLEKVGASQERGEEAQEYARFRALGDKFGDDWRAWPDGAEPDAGRVKFYLAALQLAHKQLGDLAKYLEKDGQSLYLDLPIGAGANSYDVFIEPEAYAKASLGAPPDDLFRGGQRWGLPAMIPEAARRSGHANFRKAVRHHMEHAGVLRIDHILGVYRTWWVPDGRPATAGAYVLQPMDELLAIVCLESFRTKTAVVGENLGTVPPEMQDALERHGIMGMRVPRFGMSDPSVTELVALTTHDVVPFLSWWDGLDIDDMVDLGLIHADRPAEEYANRVKATEVLEKKFDTEGAEATLKAMHLWMGESESRIVMLALDDLVGELRRHNVPGTTGGRPNWRLRLEQTVEGITADGTLLAHLKEVAALRSGSIESSRFT